MRTDSLNLAKEAVDSVREYILSNYGKEYLPSKAKIYNNKSKGAQEAHEAIRPTIINFTPEIAKDYLSTDEYKLYKLIYNRFVASQMNDAKFEAQTILFKGQKSIFKATGSRLIFDGFHKVYGNNNKDKLLLELQEGKKALLNKIQIKQNFTEPPPRYTEASIIKVLESLGIGRPSTYAPTISTLLSREYIQIDKKRIIPTKMAFIVIKLLEENFSDIVDSNFTANMENNLDEIAEAKINWQDTLKEFYYPFMKKITEGKKNIKSLKVAIPTGEECPLCKGELLLRKGRYGEFIACSNFPKCKYTRNINKEDNSQIEKNNQKCDKCGADMVIKESRRGKFLACSAYPNCKNTKPLIPNRILDVACPKCGAKIEEKMGKRGNKFFGCQAYPKCKFISNIEPTNKKCPKCNNIMGKKELKNSIIYQCLECTK